MTTPQKVADDVVVTLDYELRLDSGEIIDSSVDVEGLSYLHGHGEILPALEEALTGMEVGEEKGVTLTPEQGYGQPDPEAKIVIPATSFPPDMPLDLGMELTLEDQMTGQLVQAYVTEIRPDGVVLDLNHPLAGENLNFYIKILGLREATAEELAHGHAH